MKKKIAIPSEEEVARFGGGPPPPESTGGQPAAEPSPGSATPAADQAGADTGQPAAEAAASPEALKAELEQWRDRFLRAKAELSNYQRRAEKDRADYLRYANAGLAKALLPILDDLERVIAAAAEHKNDPDVLTGGVKLMLDNFLKVFKDFGVQAIDAVGKPFDPSQHEAMMQQPSAEHAEPTVLTEAGKGYRLHDRVLRPARVIVSKPAEPPAVPCDSAGEDPEE